MPFTELFCDRVSKKTYGKTTDVNIEASQFDV